MAYEIRVVFQTLEAYQSAVERLYSVFGAGLPEISSDVPLDRLPEAPDGEGSLDRWLEEEPSLSGDGYTFTVEDRTR